MIKDKSIFIKNIYYMLSYAYHPLKQDAYKNISTEEFDHIHDLFAAILAKGVGLQLKHGLYRKYVPMKSELSALRGKINILDSIQLKVQKTNRLVCEYDELSENNYFNQILKTTMLYLISFSEVTPVNKAALKKVILFFSNVDIIDVHSINWSMLGYSRNNATYKMLMNICYLVLHGLLLTTEKGRQKLSSFFVDPVIMPHLYEKFVLEYYHTWYPELHPMPSEIKWNVDDDTKKFLPKMRTDITLSYNGKTLIIDTKYYEHTMQTVGAYDSYTIHSNNMYQIFTYVKNHDRENNGNVSGMLLYAKTDEDITPDNDYSICGNKISVKTLDLSKDFKGISTQLNRIAESLYKMS